MVCWWPDGRIFIENANESSLRRHSGAYFWKGNQSLKFLLRGSPNRFDKFRTNKSSRMLTTTNLQRWRNVIKCACSQRLTNAMTSSTTAYFPPDPQNGGEFLELVKEKRDKLREKKTRDKERESDRRLYSTLRPLEAASRSNTGSIGVIKL